MRTEELIDVLGRSARPVDGAIVRRRFVMALLIGGGFAVCVAIALLGTRPDLATARAVGFVAAKVGFGAAIFSLSAFYLVRIARPGGEGRVSLPVMAAPFLAIVALAAAVLAGASPAHWDRMVMGRMPGVDTAHRRRAVRGGDLGRPLGGPHGPRRSRRVRRSRRRQHQCDGVRAALHRRLAAVRDRLVRRHDCPVHTCWHAIGTASASLVSQLFTST
jgi:hypothetical protein